MKLIGNSVSVPVIDMLIKSIISTGVIDLPINGKDKEKEHEGTSKAKMSIEAMCPHAIYPKRGQ